MSQGARARRRSQRTANARQRHGLAFGVKAAMVAGVIVAFLFGAAVAVVAISGSFFAAGVVGAWR